MRKISATPIHEPLAAELQVPPPPLWVRAWLDDSRPAWCLSDDYRTSLSRGDRAALASIIVPGARDLEADAFREIVIRAYHAVHDLLKGTNCPHIVRMWNHLPAIHEALDADCDRYMVFNAGRFAAMSDWFGGADQIARHVPAASGVGHGGDDLVIHALGAAQEGKPLENPRQIPAHRYSRRYGPLPPCFARAVRMELPRPALLIAGTAAILGEDSMHRGNLAEQLDLTFANLQTVIRTAGRSAADPLTQIEHARVYVPDPATQSFILDAARERFENAAEIEIVEADLCRAELLVEIEALASCSPTE